MRQSDPGHEPEADEARHTPSATRCESCGGLPSWESICDGWGERWMASCSCGRIETFFPDRRQHAAPVDPLTLFLQGHLRPRRPATPPWVRLFLNSIHAPWATQWRHSFDACPSCDVHTVFGLLAWPRPFTAAVCTVCLNCGYSSARYSNPAAGTQEPFLEGSVWAPACPAVKRLRECVYLPVAAGDAIGSEPESC